MGHCGHSRIANHRALPYLALLKAVPLLLYAALLFDSGGDCIRQIRLVGGWVISRALLGVVYTVLEAMLGNRVGQA